jgi:hypothetical protein
MAIPGTAGADGRSEGSPAPETRTHRLGPDTARQKPFSLSAAITEATPGSTP